MSQATVLSVKRRKFELEVIPEHKESKSEEKSGKFKAPKVDRPAPFDTLGYVTYKRTYSRRLNDNDVNSETESWEQTLERIINGCNDQIGCNFTSEEQNELYDLLYNLKFSVAGRFLWQLGSETVEKQGLISLNNCAATVINEPVYPFTWIFDLLMLGAGTGANITQEQVYSLPPVRYVDVKRCDEKDADFIVPDSREGWVKLLGKLLKSHFFSGKGFTYSCMLIRSKGAPIKGFGGTASGPDILEKGISMINKVINDRAGHKLRPIDVLDIINIIGMVVVSGNVRRTAIIAVGDYKDIEYIRAKRWDLGNIPNWRAYSNNSVFCDDVKDLPEEFWEGYKGNGEPYGLINRRLIKECGRIGDKQYPDPDFVSPNPCSEINLNNYELCCLSEVFLPNISTYEELLKCLRYAYRICKQSLTIKCHHARTDQVIKKNMRIGIGITGYLQATQEQRNWLRVAYEYLRNYDKSYSREHDLPISIKLTTVKPSGTLSLLAGVTPGCHPAYARHYIRRVRFNSNSNLLSLLRQNGYYMEYQVNFDGSLDHTTMVVEFPYKVSDHTVIAKDMTAIQQLEVVKELQNVWADNSVSVTVYYKKEELPAIREWLENNYRNHIKAISFLLHSEHGFKQAPYEEISQERYEEMINQVTPINNLTQYQSLPEDEMDSVECRGKASCPIK